MDNDFQGRVTRPIFELVSSMLFLILAILSCLATSALLAEPSHALPKCNYNHNDYTGEMIYRPGSAEAAYVDYIQGRWKCDTQLAKSGALCGRWASMVRNTIGASFSTGNYRGLRLNRKNFLRKCKGVKPGTVLVAGQATWENGSTSHAVVLFKVTDKKVYWADCNWNHDNVIHYRSGTVRDFINFYHYKSSKYSYLHIVVKVRSYKWYRPPRLVSTGTVKSGKARISWTRMPYRKFYKVYRSRYKNGKYKLIATTKNSSYVDKSAKRSLWYWYKVRAYSRKYRSAVTNKVRTKTRLDRPRTKIKFMRGKGRLSWEKIPGAVKYRVYKRKGERGRWRRVFTTKGTGYVSKHLRRTTNKNKQYWFKVKAISRKGYSNSFYSGWITSNRYAWIP